MNAAELSQRSSTDPTAVLRGEDRPRVVIVTASLDIGGAERHIALVSAGLARRGWPVTVFCTNKLGPYAHGMEAAGVNVIGPPFAADLNRTPIAKRALLVPFAMRRLAGVIARERPAIAHFFLAEAYIAGAPIALLRRVPVTLMSRRSLNVYQLRWPGSRRLEKWLHRRMTAIIANSQRVVDDLLTDEGCPRERLGLIYNGVPLQQFAVTRDRSALRAALGIPADAVVGIVIANLVSYKGHADLVAGLARIASRLSTPWVLLCAGEDRGALDSLQRQVAASGLQDHVRFLGQRSDVADLLQASDIGILSSHEEGFSNAVIEGMAAGLPMLVTAVGGNAEAVLDGATGFVVPPRDSVAIGEAFLRLASEPELRAAMGRAGLERACRSFDIEACIDNYERLYLGLLAGRPIGDIAGIGLTAGPAPIAAG